jgi:large subunit ribosomal protein L17
MRKFGRLTKVRLSLLRNLAISLFQHGQIITTEAKAKDLRSFAESLMTRCKEDNLNNRRYLLSCLYNNSEIVEKMYKDYSEVVKTRPGGYLRILKLGYRSDSAPIAAIQVIRND